MWREVEGGGCVEGSRGRRVCGGRQVAIEEDVEVEGGGCVKGSRRVWREGGCVE